MPIGALTALSISTAVVQFVDFAVKLVSKGHKLRHAAGGELLEYGHFDSSARRLLKLNNAIIDTFEGSKLIDLYHDGGSIPLDSDRDLKAVCKSCNEAAERLLVGLERLKGYGRNRIWQSYRQAFKSIWSKQDILNLQNELDLQRTLLDTTLLASLRYNLVDLKTVLRSRSHDGTWQRELVNDVDRTNWRENRAGDVAEFGFKIAKIAAAATEAQLVSQVLQQLEFKDRHDRHDRISHAHRQTFQWIYCSSAELIKHHLDLPSFADWLESDQPLYWITGKPGSGKSTLTKFISQDKRTHESLARWAGTHSLVVAKFYFWNSGSEIQMSLMGMLRTLLIAALSKWRALVCHAFPERWSASKVLGEDNRPWTEPELLKALDIVIRSCAKHQRKLCCFVDGLDEFSGEHDMLVRLFQNYAALPNFKLCLSSRPWPIFDDAFNRAPNLILQNLTFNDIRQFADSRLTDNSGFRMLKEIEPEYAARLVSRVAQKASGVYLWVAIVVESLLAGLSNRDRISDLEARLEEIPDDLDRLYGKMLLSIEPRYLPHASQLFQIVRAAEGRLTALMLSWADEEDPQRIYDRALAPLSASDISVRCDIIQGRLQSRCRGLLEIPTHAIEDDDSDHDAHQEITTALRVRTAVAGTANHIRIRRLDPAKRKVAYLHRTARDFLHKPNIWQTILSSSPEGYCPDLAIVRSYLMSAKTFDRERSQWAELSNNIHDTLKFASAIESRLTPSPIRELDEIMDAVTHCCSNVPPESVEDVKQDVTLQRIYLRGANGFLETAAEYFLPTYVQDKLQGGFQVFPPESYRSLLEHAVTQLHKFASLTDQTMGDDGFAAPDVRFIERLLATGEDPNKLHCGTTPWQHALEQACKSASERSLSDAQRLTLLRQWCLVVEAFLKHGADPDMNREGEYANRIREAFGRDLPVETRQLEKLLRHSQGKLRRLGKFFKYQRRTEQTDSLLPLFRQIQLDNAQIPAITMQEYYQSHKKPNKASSTGKDFGWATFKRFQG